MERGGFEPPKAFAGRFTVCSLWPLGHLSSSVPLPRSRADGRSRTGDLLITSQPLYRLSYIGAPPALGFIESTNRCERILLDRRARHPIDRGVETPLPPLTKRRHVTSSMEAVKEKDRPPASLAAPHTTRHRPHAE